MAGTVTLHRFNGLETFPIERGEIVVSDEGDGPEAILEIDCGPPLRQCPDTADYPASVNGDIQLGAWDTATAVGRRIEVPEGLEDELVARLYYYQHEPVDGNVVELLESDASGRVRVRWTGRRVDPNHYDRSKPETIVEIEGWFPVRVTGA
jgi:hypothetical protein